MFRRAPSAKSYKCAQFCVYLRSRVLLIAVRYSRVEARQSDRSFVSAFVIGEDREVLLAAFIVVLRILITHGMGVCVCVWCVVEFHVCDLLTVSFGSQASRLVRSICDRSFNNTNRMEQLRAPAHSCVVFISEISKARLTTIEQSSKRSTLRICIIQYMYNQDSTLHHTIL